MDIYPLKFEPVFLEKIWGGFNLNTLFPDKCVPSDVNTGEIWELTARDDYSSVIANGSLAGKTLRELVAEEGKAVAGEHALESGNGRFPILYKFLDAAKQLSVQVHPDDRYAEEHNNDLGKMEAWYILQADEDAKIVKGLKPGYGKDDFRKLLEEERLDECLNMFSVRPGDVVFLAPQTLHTLGNGVVLFEIQQSSDVTYRAYDWGRMGTDGKPRELHVEQVFDVADFNPPIHSVEPVERPDQQEYVLTLIDCPYFMLDEVKTVSGFQIGVPDDRFIAMTVIRGTGVVVHDSDVGYRAGDTLLLPPGLECSVRPDGDSIILVSYVPPAVAWQRNGA